MKKIYILLFTCTTLLLLHSCSSDDSPISANELSNSTWYLYKLERYLDGECKSTSTSKYLLYFYDDEDGCYLNADYRCPISGGNWKISGGQLIVEEEDSYSGLDPEISKYKILSVTGEGDGLEMVLQEEYEDDEYDYYLYYLRLDGYMD